jgi:hypothetical protein
MTSSSTTDTPLIARYRQLPVDDRRILQVLSVIYLPVKLGALQQAIRGLKWKDQQGRAMSQRITPILRRKLHEAGFIDLDGYLMSCAAGLADPLSRDAVRSGDFEAIATVSGELLTGTSTQRHTTGVGQVKELLQPVRIALYRGDDEQVLTTLGGDTDRFDPLPWDSASILSALCTHPFDADWLDQQGDAIKFQVLVPIIRESAWQLFDIREQLAMAERVLPTLTQDHPQARRALAEMALIQGRTNGVESYLAGDDSPVAIGLMAWLRFLQGRYDDTIHYAEAALAATRKLTRKRKVHLAGVPGALYLLALLISDRGGHLDMVLTQIDIGFATRPDPTSKTLLLWFYEAALILKNPDQPQPQHLYRDPEDDTPPLAKWLRGLLLYWLDLPIPPWLPARLRDQSQQARHSGLHWFAEESALLLQALAGRDKDIDTSDCPPSDDSERNFESIVQHLQPRAYWQVALQALQELTQPDVTALTGIDTKAYRLVWFVGTEADNWRLEAREQKVGKTGKWTKGRVVALKRLAEDSETFDYLRPEDHRLRQAIVQHTEYEYYGYYGKTVYSLHGGNALLAAVGHPHLYRADDPSQPLTLVPGEATLLVQQQDQQLLLSLHPYPQDEAEPVIVTEIDPGTLQLVELNPELQRIAAILGTDGLTVPSAAKQQVLDSIAAIAPLLAVHSDIGGGREAETVAADSRPHIQLQPLHQGLRLDCHTQPLANGTRFHPGEGSTTIMVEVDGKALQTTRDLDAERQQAEHLRHKCPALAGINGWHWELEDPEEALETLLALQQLDEQVVLEWPRGKPIRLSREAGVAQMQVRLSKKRDWFGIDGELVLDDGRVLQMSHLLALIGHGPGRFVALDDGEFLSLTRELRERLDTLRVSGDGRFHPLAAELIEQATDGMVVKAGKPWRDQLERLQQARELEPRLPSTLQAELRDYQHEGYAWLARLAHWGAGACLADDMGLGKTLQALALLLRRAPDGPALVLAPTSVCDNWLTETQRFAPTLRPTRFGPGDRAAMLEQAGPYDLIVCSYGLLQSEAERLADIHWHSIVADEAQAIKNPNTKRSRAAMALNGDFRAITTGTPIENHLGELWNLYRFINPGLLGSQQAFNQRYATPIEQHQDDTARQRRKSLIRPFILRRLKSEVLTELPPRTDITLHVELGADETAFYQALRLQAMERMSAPDGGEDAGKQRFQVLAEITRLRRACCNPRLVLPDSPIASAKLQAFTDIVDELRKNHHKALVFSQFTSHLALVRERLDQAGIHYQYLDGSTSTRRRKQAVDAFQAGDGDLFLISLKAGGSGLNLTAADYVIHLDPWWNPAVEDQASDRAHRIGQQRPVTVYRLVAKDTIEERIVDLHQHKRDLADSLLEGSEMSGKLSVDEMMALIREEQD